VVVYGTPALAKIAREMNVEVGSMWTIRELLAWRVDSPVL
jgi:hypothetical protein